MSEDYAYVDLFTPAEQDILLPKFNDLYLSIPGRWKGEPLDWNAGQLRFEVYTSEFGNTPVITKTNADFDFSKSDDQLAFNDVANLLIDRVNDMNGTVKLGIDYFYILVYVHPDPDVEGTVIRGRLRRDFK